MKGEKGQLFFKIPEDQGVMTKLVEAVPSSWLWVDGGLSPCKALIESGQVEQGTGFMVERFHSIHPTIVGTWNQTHSRRNQPNLYAMMVEQKLPGFVQFEKAGYERDTITLELAKRLAI